MRKRRTHCSTPASWWRCGPAPQHAYRRTLRIPLRSRSTCLYAAADLTRLAGELPDTIGTAEGLDTEERDYMAPDGQAVDGTGVGVVTVGTLPAVLVCRWRRSGWLRASRCVSWP